MMDMVDMVDMVDEKIIFPQKVPYVLFLEGADV